MEGQIEDCNCNFETVDRAVSNFFIPILVELTATPYFRYFRVNLDTACPFWDENGECASEGCSICECEPTEIPSDWISKPKDTNEDEIGWVSRSTDTNQVDPSANTTLSEKQNDLYMIDVEDVKWMSKPDPSKASLDDELWVDMHEDESDSSIYVNLLKNPERYTGVYKSSVLFLITTLLYRILWSICNESLGSNSKRKLLWWRR